MKALHYIADQSINNNCFQFLKGRQVVKGRHAKASQQCISARVFLSIVNFANSLDTASFS